MTKELNLYGKKVKKALKNELLNSYLDMKKEIF
jgi:hypothetical protein